LLSAPLNYEGWAGSKKRWNVN